MSTVEQNKGIDAGIGIHPVAGRIGAEIEGIRLGADLGPETVGAIRQGRSGRRC
jgi:alpha-ketoglutarate-dependent taurine dioxygenase